MKWTRMRTWAGRHPVWAVNLVTAFALLCCVLFFVVGFSAALQGREIANEVAQTVLIAVILSLLFLVGTASAAFVSLLLARAGLRPRRVLLAAVWVPLFAASGFAALLTIMVLVGIAVTGKLPWIDWPGGFLEWVAAIKWLGVLRTLMVVSVTLAAGYLVGWMIAAVFVRHKIRKGQWETIGPTKEN